MWGLVILRFKNTAQCGSSLKEWGLTKECVCGMRTATLAGQCRRKGGEGLNEVGVRMRIEQDRMLWQKGQGIGVEDEDREIQR
jgi:hypothetical protein